MNTSCLYILLVNSHSSYLVLPGYFQLLVWPQEWRGAGAWETVIWLFAISLIACPLSPLPLLLSLRFKPLICRPLVGFFFCIGIPRDPQGKLADSG